MEKILSTLVILTIVCLIIARFIFGSNGVNSDINSTHNSTTTMISKNSHSILGYP